MQYFQWFEQGGTLIECRPVSLFFRLILVRVLVRILVRHRYKRQKSKDKWHKSTQNKYTTQLFGVQIIGLPANASQLETHFLSRNAPQIEVYFQCYKEGPRPTGCGPLLCGVEWMVQSQEDNSTVPLAPLVLVCRWCIIFLHLILILDPGIYDVIRKQALFGCHVPMLVISILKPIIPHF